VFLYDLDSREEMEKFAFALVERIYALNRKEAYQFPDYRVTVSIGIAASYPKATYEDLLSRSDLAVYQAKDAGKNCYRVYEDTMH
nr:diguanylate cyclase [Lachnospiraceae bacterium]